MMEVKRVEGDVGVIVARFQVPYLTASHMRLITSICSRHKKVLIFLGVSKVLCSRKNPLDFTTRRAMVLETYPPQKYSNITILPIVDMNSDGEWSNVLDQTIRSVHPIETIVMYGGRDSFLPHYEGKFPTVTLEDQLEISGTAIRLDAFHEMRPSEDFRRGVCYAIANQYPKVVPTVDIVIRRKDEVLLGKKAGEKGWRFIGGFAGQGESYETAARREAFEETGASVSDITYICSLPINDWRFQDTGDEIKTILFEGTYDYGSVSPADDIADVAWFYIDNLPKVAIVPAHMELMKKYLQYLSLTKANVKIKKGEVE